MGRSVAGSENDIAMAPGSGGWELLWRLCLQREGMNRAADLLLEDLIHQAVLLDAAAVGEGRCRDGRAEVIARARVILDLDERTRDRGLDALLDVLRRGHFSPQSSRYTLESDDRSERQGRREGARVPRLPAAGRRDRGPARGGARRRLLGLSVPVGLR